MNLQNERELEVSRQKLQELELIYAKTLADSSQKGYSRDLTLRTLRRSINHLKEEMVRFEAHINVGTANP